MICTKCGTKTPDDQPDLVFCLNCGQVLLPNRDAPQAKSPSPPQAKRTGWEYKLVTVSLGDLKTKDYLKASLNEIILARLHQEGMDGWEADGPMDAAAEHGAIQITYKKAWWGGATRNPRSVAIRLKRVAQD